MSLNSRVAPDRDPRGQVIGRLPDWGPEAVADFEATLTSTETLFPCTFAVTGARKAALRFAFVDEQDDPGTWSALPGILAEYLEASPRIGKETSLIVLFGPQPGVAALDEYRTRFWEVLQYLHDRDPASWPESVPKDTEDPAWEFCFGGTPVFVVCNTPAHTTRKSRYNPSLMITFQPRWVFDAVSASTPGGAAARRVIRRRLLAFDGVEPSPDLGSYGDPDNREWRQYFLPDTNTEAPQPACPFRHR